MLFLIRHWDEGPSKAQHESEARRGCVRCYLRASFALLSKLPFIDLITRIHNIAMDSTMKHSHISKHKMWYRMKYLWKCVIILYLLGNSGPRKETVLLLLPHWLVVMKLFIFFSWLGRAQWGDLIHHHLPFFSFSLNMRTHEMMFANNAWYSRALRAENGKNSGHVYGRPHKF